MSNLRRQKRPNFIHSYTRLVTYTACPLSYKLQYLSDVPEKLQSAELQIGSGAHNFFEDWHNYLLDNGQINSAAVEKIAAKSWVRELRDPDLYREFLSVAKDFATHYSFDRNAWDYSRAEVKLSFDKEWKACHWNDDQGYFRAKIDRLDIQGEHARITDYKVSYGGKSSPFQIELYAYLVSLIKPDVEVFEVVLHYILSDWKETRKIHRDSLSIVKLQVESLIDAIESEAKWKARPGARCANCPVAHVCTEKPSALQVINDIKSAIKIAGDISLMEAQIKVKKHALRAWCEHKGPVSANGLTHNFYAREKMVADVGHFINLMMNELKMDPWDYLTVNTTAVKRLCRKNPNAGDVLSPAVEVVVTREFRSKKDDEEQ